jgi:hypothetical protein
MSEPNCPGRDELTRFAVGDLAAADLARLAAHVEHCTACEAALRVLDGDTDALVTALRRPPGTPSEVPPAVLTAARSALDSRPAPDAHPRRVGKFELREELGSGSFGTVFRAFDTELRREVAVKILRAGHLAGKEDAERFLRGPAAPRSSSTRASSRSTRRARRPRASATSSSSSSAA